MKSKFFVFLLAAAILVGFAACREAGTGEYVMNNAANLTSLRIADIELASAAIPTPIDSGTWDEDEPLALSDAQKKTLQFLRQSDITNVRIWVGTSAHARVEWGIGDRVTRPPVFYDARVPATFQNNDYLYLKVTSEDTTTTQYYCFYAQVYNAVIDLANVIVAGRQMDIMGGGAEWQDAEPGEIRLNQTQALGSNIEAVAFSDFATFRFAKVSDATTAPTDWVTGSPRPDADVERDVLDETGNPTGEKETVTVPQQGVQREFSFTDGEYLYIEVTAENTVDVAFYKFLVTVGRITNIAKLEMLGDGTDVYEVVGKGIPSSSWSGANGVIVGAFANADQPTAGFKVRITLEDPDGSIQYAKIATATTAEPSTYTAIANATTSSAATLYGDKEVLVIKVTPKNTTSGVPAFYKVRIDLLAANFLIQPISQAYYNYKEKPDNYNTIMAEGAEDWTPGSTYLTYKLESYSPGTETEFDAAVAAFGGKTTADALYAKLDRAVPSGETWSYQWYEANSWYGGYGFDADGNVAYLNSGGVTERETGFGDGVAGGTWYARDFDEKKNVSFFNGGNSTRYAVPGRPMNGTGASTKTQGTGNLSGNLTEADSTGTTTTVPGPVPVINRRPFIAGYTNETHYYWVVVKDASGKTVTSGRAAIVSERDSGKLHHVIDVNNYFPTTITSLDNVTKADLSKKISFRNIEPFVKKYDKYSIPLHFPSGFDIKKYKVATAQAKFYLIDGTEWVQNWTQGNLSFDDSTGKPYVLFYNLTNNNAGVGLSGDSKEPAGADLDDNPDFVSIYPSGDNVVKNFPPLEQNSTPSDGRPAMVSASSIANSDMQGWFCGFIDLVELRFEGPPRN